VAEDAAQAPSDPAKRDAAGGDVEPAAGEPAKRDAAGGDVEPAKRDAAGGDVEAAAGDVEPAKRDAAGGDVEPAKHDAAGEPAKRDVLLPATDTVADVDVRVPSPFETFFAWLGPPRGYQLTRWLIFRLLGFVYVFAFLGLIYQGPALLGSQG